MKVYKNWSLNEIALLRAAILNKAEDVQFLAKALKRSEDSIRCRLGRERMNMGYPPKYTGKTIGFKKTPLISI